MSSRGESWFESETFLGLGLTFQCYGPHSSRPSSDDIKRDDHHAAHCPSALPNRIAVAELTLTVEAAALAEKNPALLADVGPGGPKAAPVCTKGTVVLGEAGKAGYRLAR